MLCCTEVTLHRSRQSTWGWGWSAPLTPLTGDPDWLVLPVCWGRGLWAGSPGPPSPPRGSCPPTGRRNSGGLSPRVSGEACGDQEMFLCKFSCRTFRGSGALLWGLGRFIGICARSAQAHLGAAWLRSPGSVRLRWFCLGPSPLSGPQFRVVGEDATALGAAVGTGGRRESRWPADSAAAGKR